LLQYTLFANSSTSGSPPLRALFFEFPDEPELFGVDRQYLVGRDILVTPVLTPNVTTVDGIFPGRGRVIWRDWFTHDVVNATVGANTTLSAPLGHINIHIRDGSALLLHSKPAYTTYETREGPFSLLISQAADGYAYGSAYIDDGESSPPGPSKTLKFAVKTGELVINSAGPFSITSKLQDVTILGVAAKPSGVVLQGKAVTNWTFVAAQEKLVVTVGDLDLNSGATLSWK